MTTNTFTKRLATALAAAGLLAVAGVGATQAAGSFAAGGGQAAANVNCSVPNHVVCTVTSNKGIASVKFFINHNGSQLPIVNKSYRSCPKSVQVSYDSAYHVANKQIVECQTGKLLFK